MCGTYFEIRISHSQYTDYQEIAVLKRKQYKQDQHTYCSFINPKEWHKLSDMPNLHLQLKPKIFYYPFNVKFMWALGLLLGKLRRRFVVILLEQAKNIIKQASQDH